MGTACLCMLALLALTHLRQPAQALPVTALQGSQASQDPVQRVEAFRRLAEWCALRKAAAALPPEGGSLDGLLSEARGLLVAVLPELENASDRELELLQDLAARALAADLSAAPPTGQRSRLARALTLVNIAWFLACCLVVLGVVSLVGRYLAALVLLVPLPAWEAAGYLTSLAIVHRATLASPAAAPYVALTGLLAFTACLGSSFGLHLANRIKNSQLAASLMLGICTVVWALVAVRLQAPLLGMVSVWLAMSSLGFVIAVFPFVTVIGFEHGLAAPFTASLALVAVFLPFKVAPEALPLPAALRPFESGVWLWCPLVANVANLILSSRKWGRSIREAAADALSSSEGRRQSLQLRLRLLLTLVGRYALFQLPSLAVIGGTLACGVVLDVEACRAVGSVFAFLWLLSSLSQADWQRVGVGWAALLLGLLLWGAAYSAHAWPALLGMHIGSGGRG